MQSKRSLIFAISICHSQKYLIGSPILWAAKLNLDMINAINQIRSKKAYDSSVAAY